MLESGSRFKPYSKIFYWPFQGSSSFVDHLCFSALCLLCLCVRLFMCALWSPAGKGLTYWLSFVVSNFKFVTFPLVTWVRCGTWLYRFLIFALRCFIPLYFKRISLFAVVLWKFGKLVVCVLLCYFVVSFEACLFWCIVTNKIYWWIDRLLTLYSLFLYTKIILNSNGPFNITLLMLGLQRAKLTKSLWQEDKVV